MGPYAIALLMSIGRPVAVAFGPVAADAPPLIDLLFVPMQARGKFPIVWTPNKEDTGDTVNRHLRSGGAAPLTYAPRTAQPLPSTNPSTDGESDEDHVMVAVSLCRP